jgi:hypothetical protein
MPAVGQWHTFEIEAVGPKITVRLNGQQVSQLTNGDWLAKGYIGLQNHHAGSKVQFTRLRIKKLTTLEPEPLRIDATRRDARIASGTTRRRATA